MLQYFIRPKYFMGLHFSQKYVKAVILSSQKKQIYLEELIKAPYEQNHILLALKKGLKQKRYHSGIMLNDHQVQFRTILVNKNLIEKEIEEYIKLQLENEFQNINEKLSWDFFQKTQKKYEIEYQLAITKEKTITKYQNIFHEVKLPLKKIDIESYALRAFLSDFIKNPPTTLMVIIEFFRVSIYVISEQDVHYQQTKTFENSITKEDLIHTINQNINLFQINERSRLITHKLIIASDDFPTDIISQIDNETPYEILNVSLQNSVIQQNEKQILHELHHDWYLPMAIAYQGAMDEII